MTCSWTWAASATLRSRFWLNRPFVSQEQEVQLDECLAFLRGHLARGLAGRRPRQELLDGGLLVLHGPLDRRTERVLRILRQPVPNRRHCFHELAMEILELRGRLRRITAPLDNLSLLPKELPELPDQLLFRCSGLKIPECRVKVDRDGPGGHAEVGRQGYDVDEGQESEFVPEIHVQLLR